MGLFKSLKGDHPNAIGNATSGPSDNRSPQSQDSKHIYDHSKSPSHAAHQDTSQNLRGSSHGHLDPPPGPPPGQNAFAPPPGPPPGHVNGGTTSYSSKDGPTFQPPAGPPPNRQMMNADPPPYHDWTSVPDTALLPPPPSFVGHDTSSTSNADSVEADRAHHWCAVNPIIPPHQPSSEQYKAVADGDIRIIKPREFTGELLMPRMGMWKGSSRAGAKDSALITSAPLYFACADFPRQQAQKRIIYFEVEIVSLGKGGPHEDSSIAIGYCAMPYPTWRLPGWERGSLAIHSDDGCRYVNDTWGGKDFTSPIKAGDTVGLGMSFCAPDNSTSDGQDLNVDVFFTRNGQKEGGWNLHEELDAETDQGVDGLDGLFDLYGVVGVFGGAEFTVNFKRDTWLWIPR